MRIGKFLVLVVALIGIAACASVPEPAPAPEPAPDPATAPEPADTPSGGVPTSAGMTAIGPEALMADLRPRNGRPVFLGVANRLRNRDEEEAAAILHAAEQASRYVRIAAQYRYVAQRAGRSIGYVEDIDAQWDANLADRLVESVEVLETGQNNEGTYVLAMVDGIPAPPALDSIPVAGAGVEPRWVSQPPVIPGHLVSVGISQRSRRFRDSLDTADQEALKSVLLQAGATVRLIQDAQAIERQGTREMVTSAEDASAVFRSFYVAARYASPDGRYYYSLVVAREE